MPTLEVATGKVALHCDDSMVLSGSIQPVRAPGQQGELRATSALIRADVPVCVVACDVVAIPRVVADRAAEGIAAACGIPFENILITASHTHHAPSTFEVHAYGPEEQFCRQLETAIVAAAKQANARLDENRHRPNSVEAEFGFALGQEATVGANSRLLLRDGSVAWTRHDPAEVLGPTGPFDPDLPVVAFRRPEGRFAAVLFNHSTHNIGRCGPGGRSPGFYGLAAQELEQALGTTVLFLPGAFGSTHNIHLPDVEAKARVRAAVEATLRRVEWGLRGPVASIKREFEFPVRHFDEQAEEEAVCRYCRKWFGPQEAEATIRVFRSMRERLAPQQGEVRRTWLQAIRLGEVALVGVPGEMFAELGLAIRRRSPFRHTAIVGLANDEIGYIPDASAFDDGGYQLWTGLHSLLPRGTGEETVQRTVAMLDELHAAGEAPDSVAEPVPVVRLLRPDDVQALQSFYNTLSAETRRLFRPMGWNATWQCCKEICSPVGRGTRHDLVLDLGGRIIGWAFLTGLETHVANLGIGIHEAFAGRGFGTRLMSSLVERARRDGAEAIELIHVADNERARRLYERCGFVKTGRRHGSDGLDYAAMKLTLSTAGRPGAPPRRER